MDTAVSRAILQRVSDGDLPETLQVGTPHRSVAFGKLDALANGFPDALKEARDRGYDATLRIAGGRAVVFHPEVIRFAWTVPQSDPVADMQDRFDQMATFVLEAIGEFGIQGRTGELPNEYCAGKSSVSIEGTGKVMGSGQRLAREAAQVGGMIVVRDADLINEVLVPVYGHLEVPMDPDVTGCIADVADITTSEMADAFVDSVVKARGNRDLGPTLATVEQQTLTLAERLVADHMPPVLA